MWKYLTALLVLLSLGGLGAAQDVCTDCYANIITQNDYQSIDNVRLGISQEQVPVDSVAIGNEVLSAAVIVVPASVDPETDSMYSKAGFARIDQGASQSIANLGASDLLLYEGAKGITWNKAIQAAWIVNQGQKELEVDENGALYWAKEGAYIGQSTVQSISNIYDYDSREQAKILNVNNKLAMIVDNVDAIIDIAAAATSTTSDTQSSAGTVTNGVEITIAGSDPATLP